MNLDKDGLASLLERLENEAQRLSGHSLDRGSVDAGIASNLAHEAADAIASLQAAIATPEAVHANMLRGGIPMLSIRQALHLHGADALEMWDRAQAAEASLASAREAALEEAANRARGWLNEWAGDLYATFESYVEARSSGKHAGRRIDPENAKMFAGQFRERAEAVSGCADEVATAILALKEVR